jgi:hypothetical protein
VPLWRPLTNWMPFNFWKKWTKQPIEKTLNGVAAQIVELERYLMKHAYQKYQTLQKTIFGQAYFC